MSKDRRELLCKGRVYHLLTGRYPLPPPVSNISSGGRTWFPMPLRYVEPGECGYFRRRRGESWQYLTANGAVIRSAPLIKRLDALALPPAYHDAWFARDAAAHIQATGIDDKGRKQYRYHDEFRAAQEATKYDGCLTFGAALPVIRKQAEKDLNRRTLCKPRIMAAIVRVLDLGSVRIGNHQYAKANKTFGATTLRKRHASVKGGRVMLDYVGKSGKTHSISIADARLARLVRNCQDIPGQQLFKFLDDSGTACEVRSNDVNEYLREHCGDFTAKHFRTWAASVLAFDYLHRAEGEPSLKAMLDEVSERLGNTPAIARKSYVHPRLIEMAQSGEKTRKLPRKTQYLSSAERGFMEFLKRT